MVDVGHDIIEKGAHDRLKEGGSVGGLVEMERASIVNCLEEWVGPSSARGLR